MEVVIDRFEGDIAVCEKPDRTMLNLQKEKLPAGAKEGDILIIKGDSIKIHSGATGQRKKDMEKLMNDLWK